MRRPIVVMMFLMFVTAACSTTHTLDERRQKLSLKSNAPIVIGKTTKKEIFEAYGQPSTSVIRGKYEVLAYSYSKETFKTMGIGGALLRAVPGVGDALLLSDLATDQGKADRENSAREWQELKFNVELSTGIVRDYYYHDSDLKGNDESETLFLRSIVAFRQKKNDEAVKMLEQAVSLNPNNHRAANSLAWHLIDLGIDLDKGIIHGQKAVQVFPDSPYNNGTLGVGYYKMGDMANAEKYLQAAVDLFPIYAPNDGRALQHDMVILQTVRNQKKVQ
jgi:tetratricopeptide (TPR) repeat protein